MIVWLTGCTSAGKTWLGDFLQHYHNWIHIDGDRRIVLQMEEEVTTNLFKSFYEYWFEYKEAPLELWVPYFQELCDRIAEAHKVNPASNIVLSFSTYPRVVRDFVRKEVKKLTGEDLTMILLEMSKDDYVRRQKDKLQQWLKGMNKTVEQVWEEHDAFKGLGEYSEENLTKYYQQAKEMKGLEPIQADEANSFTIDTNGLHVKVVPEVTRVLNLTPCEYDNEVIMKIRSDHIEEYKKLKEQKKASSDEEKTD